MQPDTAATARRKLRRLLGNRQRTRWRITHSEVLARDRMQVRRLSLVRPDGETARAFLTGPPGPWHNLPALIYSHAHGNRHDIGADELLTGRPALQAPYGEALAAQGIVALCVDLPCFGSRAQETESARAKRLMWHGQSLFGEMLADCLGAFDLLAKMPAVDPARIGAMGISMGATLSVWLAALEPRLKCLAHLCCFADLATLVEQGGHDLHGHYMTVPGLLPAFRTGEIAGLSAPRPQLACMGARDALTPPAAIDIAVADARAAYARAGAEHHFTTLIEPETGHTETPAMRAAVLAFLSTALQATSRPSAIV